MLGDLNVRAGLSGIRCLRGEGSLFVVTRRGVTAAGVQAKPLRAPSQAFQGRHWAIAWTAAWLRHRGPELLGSRELVGHNRWSAELLYYDSQGYKQAEHHPDFVANAKNGYVCIEVGVPATPTRRLEAIMQQHEGWRWTGQRWHERHSNSVDWPGVKVAGPPCRTAL